MADPPTSRIVSVLPDVGAIGRIFDYSVPASMDDRAVLGAVVRVELHGRRVGGWIVDDDPVSTPAVAIKPLAKVSGVGPPADLLELSTWAAWRWAGPRATFLRTASPPRSVACVGSGNPPLEPSGDPHPLAMEVLAAGGGVLRLPPSADRWAVALAAVVHAAREGGHALVLVPSVGQANTVGRHLADAGAEAVVHPEGWVRGREGATVVGARAAAWAPVADLRVIVLFDEHDEVWQEERAPTWHAREVVSERARRAGVPLLLVSPTPSLEALSGRSFTAPGRAEERAGWPRVEVVDRRDRDPASGLFSPELVARIREPGRAVLVLNRKGRAGLLACGRCRELARCERCEAAVRQSAGGSLVCGRCDTRRPVVCAHCGSITLKILRFGVTRAREELEALLGEPVAEITATSTSVPDARVLLGTEAVLHRVHSAPLVGFLEFDQELLAPRYRASEEALALLVRAGRMVGPRSGKGRIVVQTCTPGHEVLTAASDGDPDRVAAVEAARRTVMRFPPEAALCEVSGAAASELVGLLGSPPDLEVLGPDDSGRWLLRAVDHQVLCDHLAAVPRPAGRVRIAIDPLRL